MQKIADEKIVEMMDMALKVQLFKNIDESLRSVNENFSKVVNWKALPIEQVKDLSDAFENVSDILEKIVHQEDNNE